MQSSPRMLLEVVRLTWNRKYSESFFINYFFLAASPSNVICFHTLKFQFPDQWLTHFFSFSPDSVTLLEAVVQSCTLQTQVQCHQPTLKLVYVGHDSVCRKNQFLGTPCFPLMPAELLLSTEVRKCNRFLCRIVLNRHVSSALPFSLFLIVCYWRGLRKLELNGTHQVMVYGIS
jgi:hypothetical protein